MIAIIHHNWDSDIVLDEGELEKIIQGEILSGEIVNYDKIGEVYLSKNEDKFSPYELSLDWDLNIPHKYHFKITSQGIERLNKNNHIYERYENGLNGSKLEIYGPEKNSMIKENIAFAIQMIKESKK
jgi:hypothetical protein